MPEILKRPSLPDLAYVKIKRTGTVEKPTIMFLGGFRSDMEGTKAVFLEKLCKETGQAYVRFDYRGHGHSGGKFEEACISDWLQDASDVLENCTSGQTMLVGSSMGGWISLLLALKHPDKIHSVVGLAAAPDFTMWMEDGIDQQQKKSLDEEGFFYLENDYDDPYIITKRLLEDGRNNRFLDKKNSLKSPVCLIQGKKDTAVEWVVASKIKKAIEHDDVEIIFLDKADHRLSSSEELSVLKAVIGKMSKR